MAADHLFINLQLSRLECRHCGETLGLRLPMEIKKLARLGKAFEQNHRDCKPTDTPPAPRATHGPTDGK